MLKNIIFLIFLLINSAMSEEKKLILSPFGITLGEKVKENIQIIGENDSIVQVNPEKPISYFKQYLVVLTKEKLAYRVVAITESYKNDEYCYSSKDTFDILKNAISKKYGTEKKSYDFLHADSIWKDSRDYKNSLLKNERTHYSYWLLDNYIIGLEEKADYQGCYVRLVYEKSDLSTEVQNQKKENDLKSL